jgi:hypothetical protein
MRCSLLTLVAVIACRDKPAEPPPPAPPPPHDGVTLIQPGAAPLQVVRYHLIKGSRLSSELVCDVDVKNDGQGGAMPTMIVALDTTVDDVLGDGSAKLRIAVTGARVRDRSGSAVASDVMQAQAAALRGVVITQTLAPDGAISGSHVVPAAAPAATGSAAAPRPPGPADPASGQLDSLLRSLERVATRLPVEPVGAGAIWRERRTLPEGGIRAVSEITYTLASLAGDRLAYTSIGQSTGAPQTVDQDGVKVEVTGTHGRSEASGSIDLSRYALEAIATSTFASTMTVLAPDAGPGAERSTVEIAMTIHVAPAAGAPGAPGAGVGSPAPGPAVTAPGNAAPSPAAPPGGGDQGAHSAP